MSTPVVRLPENVIIVCAVYAHVTFYYLLVQYVASSTAPHFILSNREYYWLEKSYCLHMCALWKYRLL